MAMSLRNKMMNNKQIESKLRDAWRITDFDAVLIKDIVECVQAIHERLKVIEGWHDDRINAMHEADEDIEEASELEHGQY